MDQFSSLNSKNVKLNNNFSMPVLGLGTWQITGFEDIDRTITAAIKLGYRHIDTAWIYENEEEIGLVLKKLFQEKTIKREEIFITSKLWNTFHSNPNDGLNQSLKALQLDYLDLYLIHWPCSFKKTSQSIIGTKQSIIGTKQSIIGNKQSITGTKDENGMYLQDKYNPVPLWEHFESFVKTGKVKSIGLANHGNETINSVLKNCSIKPSVLQIEYHPYLQQNYLLNLCKLNNIQLVAYSSLGSSSRAENAPYVMEDKVINQLSEKYNCSNANVILNWIVKNGGCVIPKSCNESRIGQNMRMVDIEEGDMVIISEIGVNFRYVETLSFGPDRFN